MNRAKVQQELPLYSHILMQQASKSPINPHGSHAPVRHVLQNYSQEQIALMCGLAPAVVLEGVSLVRVPECEL